ncbi:MAG: sugar ABC transporter substrate-binding protein [Pseudomonadota bacterium]
MAQPLTRVFPCSRHIFATFVCFIAFGCTDPQQRLTVINFWAMGREGEVVQALVPEFERRHPDIRVRVQQIPWSAAHEKLLTAYAGNAMPDIFQLGNTWIPEFVALDALSDLGPWLTRSTRLTKKDFFPGIMETNTLKGITYGIPWYVDTRVLFYRKDLLEQVGFSTPPRDWRSWMTAMQRIKALRDGKNYAILMPLNDWTPLVIFALQSKAQLLKDNDQYANFNDARFHDAFTFYLELFRQGLAPAAGASQPTNVYQEFAKGHISMYVSGPWNIGEFQRRLPESMQDLWSTAAMPGPHPQRPGLSLAGGASLVISRTSEHEDASWRLIEYLCEPEQQIEFHRLTGDLPAHQQAWQDRLIADNPHVQAFWEQLQWVAAPPKIPEWERIATKITQYSEAVVRMDMTTTEALRRLDAEINRILEKRRWLMNKRQ